MDCDTTGIEPDLALVKFKKLVGGGSMQIVNQTVPGALAALGYQQEQIEAIVEFIAEHGHVMDAPGLRARALRGVRLRHGRAVDRADGARADDGRGAAVHLRCDLQDGEHARARDDRGGRRDLPAGLEDGPQGAGDLPGQLQGRPAAVRVEEEPRREAANRVEESATVVRPRRHRAGAAPAAEEAPVADGLVHRRRRRGVPDDRLLPGRRPRRGVHQARQAGLDAGRRDGRVLHRGVGRVCSTAFRWSRTSRSSPTCGSSRPA